MISTALAVIGASLSFGHGAFTLNQAHTTDARYEQHLTGHVGACQWRDRRDAVCVVTYVNIRPIDGEPSENLRALDLVTRSGECSTPVTRRTGPRSGISHSNGRNHHNCFTGPLRAIPIANSIHIYQGA